MKRMILSVGLLALISSVAAFEQAAAESRQIPSKSSAEKESAATTDKEPAPTSEVTPERSEAGQSGSSPGSEPSREVPSGESRSSEMKKDKPAEKEADTGY